MYNLAVAYAQKADYSESIGLLERSLKLEPNNKELWNNLGIAYGYIGEHNKEIDVYKHSLNIDIKNISA